MNDVILTVGLGIIGALAAVIAYFLRSVHFDLKNVGAKVDALSTKVLVHEKDLEAAERIAALEKQEILKELGVLERNQKTLFRYIDALRGGRASGNSGDEQ